MPQINIVLVNPLEQLLANNNGGGGSGSHRIKSRKHNAVVEDSPMMPLYKANSSVPESKK